MGREQSERKAELTLEEGWEDLRGLYCIRS